MNRVTPSRRSARCSAVVAAIGYGIIVVFQAALAAGAPLGEAAWGGSDPRLSTGERVGSGVAVVLWTSARGSSCSAGTRDLRGASALPRFS
jgi:hypothetical protein